MTFSSAAIIYSSANIGPGVIVNADINNSAAIAFSKMAALTAKTMVYSNASGVIVATAAPTDGQLLIGSTGAVPALATLTGTTDQVVITPGAASITLSLPQSINTTSSPTFATLTTTTTLATTFDTNVAAAGVTLVGTTLSADGTNADIDVTITPKGTGAVVISKATISAGTITGITDLALADGGTNASLVASNGGIFYSTASAGAILAGTATANQLLLSGASTTPAWSTTTYPATNAVSTLLYASSANVMAALATANDGVLITSGTGVPSISSTIPSATQDNITRTGTVTSGTWTATDIAVADGGTGSSTAAGARTNLGLVIGTDVQAYDATLLSIAALGTAADKMIYTTAADTWAELAVTSVGRALLDDTTQAEQQTTLGLGTGNSPTFTAVTLTGSGLTPLTIVSTDAGANPGLGVDHYRNSASPAANDVLVKIDFNGNDSGAAKQLYASYRVVIEDPTAASEDGKMIFSTTKAGTSTEHLRLLSTGCQVRGNETNTVAPAGFMGEVLSSTTGTAVSLTVSDTAYEIGQLTLTPGNWLAWIGYNFASSSDATGTVYSQVVLSQTTASMTAAGADGQGTMVTFQTAKSGINGLFGQVGPVNISTGSNTTIYFNARVYASTAIGTQTCDGTIYAVRVG